MKIKTSKYLKIIIIILLQTFFFNKANSEIIKKFNIMGNERVSKETIIMFSNLQIGDDIDQLKLNNSLKDLYTTNYFNNVEIFNDKGIINIKVKENPIIQKVEINGVDNNTIYENIKTITSKIEKYPFIENKVNEQVNLLMNMLKSYGYYFVKLETLINENNNNSVDLIYNFQLGEIAKIKKIKFIGNKIFKDSTLRNIVVSEEAKFWKFITRNKFLDINRINLDVLRLEKFYKNRGYYNINIKSSTAVILDENQFELVFNINAGDKFIFNNISFDKKKDISFDKILIFEKNFNDLRNNRYSEKDLKILIEDINKFILENEFIFINANYETLVLDDNKIDVLIKFEDLKKEYVERINIVGNYITDEKVVRNSLIVDEGDPYNEILFKKSISNIKSKNIFEKVEYKLTEIDSNKKIIDISVEEKPTGEIFAGAGTGTSGHTLTAGIKENNYLGLGIKLDTNINITEDSLKGKFSVLNPNYNNSDKSIKTVFESSTSDFMSTSGYKTSRTGISIGTEFEQFSDLFVNFELSNYYEDLETASTATEIVKKQEGNYFENLLTYQISYNKLDQNFKPSDGSITKFSQTLPLYADDVAIENKFTRAMYHPLTDNIILSANLFLKTINSLDDDVRVSKRVNVPGRRLRGFESGKIGPKDGSQYIGGNYASSLNLNSTLPNVFFENENIDFNLFIDLANVWEVDYNKSLDSNKIRSATGFALNWFSAIGPLSFSYAIPLSETSTDITEKFRFQIGTSF
tara:strand:+ start:8194 stop:10443 length:2250 start_codon:yes stop_codon:yes gene_type:complete